MLFSQLWNELFRVYNEQRRHKNEFWQNKHRHELIDNQIFREYSSLSEFCRFLSIIHRTLLLIICIIFEHVEKNAKRNKKDIVSAHTRERKNVQFVTKDFSIRFHIDSFRFWILHQIENRRVELWNRRYHFSIAIWRSMTIDRVLFSKNDFRRNELQNARSKIINNHWMF